MVYSCFYYSLPLAKAFDIYIIYYTTEVVSSRRHKFKMGLSTFRACLAVLGLTSHLISTIFRSTQDSVEFMMSFMEDIALLQTFYEYCLLRVNIQEYLDIVNQMKRSFSTVDGDIVKACKREERHWFFTFFVFVFLAFFVSVLEALMVNDNEWNLKRARMYDFKHPENVVPVTLYIPGGAIDLSAPPWYYMYLIIIPFFVTELTMASSIGYTNLGVFSIHLKGQYQLLHRYLRMINNQEKDANGNLKYYTNIVTGQYFTCNERNPERIVLVTPRTQKESEVPQKTDKKTLAIIYDIISYKNCVGPKYTELSEERIWGDKVDCSTMKSTEEYNPVYEEHFLKQIIQYQQFLKDIKSKVENNKRPAVISTCLMFVSIVALSSQIFISSQFKISSSDVFVLLNLYVVKLVEFSDSLDVCNQKMLLTLY